MLLEENPMDRKRFEIEIENVLFSKFFNEF